MNTNNNRTWIIIIVIVFIGIISFYLGKKSNDLPALTNNVASGTENEQVVVKDGQATTSTPKTAVTAKPSTPTPVTQPSVNTTGFNSYSDSQYNFTIKYPKYVTAKNTFTTFHEIGNNWRVYASPANQGKPVIALSIYSIDQGSYSTGKQTYPLYFMTEVRVGTSPNTKECYTPDAGYPNQKITNVIINGTTWKKFSTKEGATMKYTQVESYRTIRNNTCFAVEQIKNGTSYRDEKMTINKTDADLTTYFNVGETIVRTFTFTR